MATPNARPVPRPLRLISKSASTTSAPGPHSAPLISDPAARPAQRRQSSISYKTGAGSGGITPEARESPAQETRAGPTSRSSIAKDAGPATRSPVARDEPATLAEKHADLLRFIAQKESRCLELRTQLAQHEADLLLLKRKWERIVSKGGPRVAQSDRGDVLDGIREGVQSGLGRVFAVLEPTPNVAPQTRISPKPASTARMGISADESSSSLTSSHVSTVPDKRASVSPRARSSLSGSGSASSAGSLFDDIGGHENQSSASSALDSPVLTPDADVASAVSSPPSQAFKRNSYNFPQMQAEPAQPREDDPSAKRRRVRPASVQVVRPPATEALSPTITFSPLGRQVSAWVPDLNRKWEELKSNETLTKQSKRASVLLNDVLAALTPPAPSPTLRHTPSHTVLDSTFFDPVMAASIGAGSGGSGDTPGSLLDEDEDDSAGAVGEVLRPEVKSTPVVRAKTDDDEWNW